VKEFILDNWEILLVVSFIPMIVAHFVTNRLGKKADEKLVKELKDMLVRDNDTSEG